MTKYTELRASRGFMELLTVKAQVFENIGLFAGHLSDLARHQRDKDVSWDDIEPVVADTDRLHWEPRLTVGKKRHRMREHAFGQFCSMLGFPARVLAKCPPDLARQNLNHFFMTQQLEEKRKDMKLRFEREVVRAIVSKRYVAVSHKEIVDRVQQADWKLETNYAGATEARMHMLILDPTDKFDGPDGSEMSHCTYVTNSETGEGCFEAVDLWYDFICENRMIWGAKMRAGSFRRVHVGDVRKGLDQLFEWLGGNRRTVVEIAKERLKQSALKFVAETDDEVMEYMTERGFARQIADQARVHIRQRWPDASQVNRFQIGAGLTRAAQALGMEQRRELELASAFAVV